MTNLQGPSRKAFHDIYSRFTILVLFIMNILYHISKIIKDKLFLFSTIIFHSKGSKGL